MGRMDYCPHIIPYQELLGNYDAAASIPFCATIIPYQELLGNYDSGTTFQKLMAIIPYQELLGNYDPSSNGVIAFFNYTIPRAIREL